MYAPKICRVAERAATRRAIAGVLEPFRSGSLITGKSRQVVTFDPLEIDPPDMDVASRENSRG